MELLNAKARLFEENISLQAYPPEYIFSEKLEAILHHGDLGSRMKDYYDCFKMIQATILDEKLLKEALVETTSNRGTELKTVPENIEPFSDLWSNFVKANNFGDLDMNEVIKTINSILQKIL